MGAELEAFAVNTLEWIRREAHLTFEPLILPPLQADFRGRHALVVNPFDVEGTALAIDQALRMDPGERHRRATGLRAAVERNRLEDWVDRQLDDLGVAGA